MRISDAIDRALKTSDQIAFSIREGLLTPESTETSDSFVVTIHDQAGYKVNFVETSMTVTMREGHPIEHFFVQPDILTVGESSFHKISLETPVLVLDGFKM